MRALTLTQPWATLVILGVKEWETRSWGTAHHGRIAVHAAKAWTGRDRAFAADLHLRGILPVPPEELPLGAVLGTVLLVGHLPTDEALGLISGLEAELGDYSPGRRAWALREPRPLDEPVPARGSLGLWEWGGWAA